MVFRRNPRNYRQTDYPLIHDFQYQFSLDVEDETKNSTIVTLLRSSELTGVEAVEVNPSHGSFLEDSGPTIFMGSIVPRLSVTITAKLDQAAFDIDSIEHMIFKWMPIYTAFLNSLDAENVGTPSSDIETIIELGHDVTKKRTNPLYSTVDLTSTPAVDHPVSIIPATEGFSTYGLTTDLKMESVAFDEQAFWDAKRYYTNKGMLNKVTGSMKTVNLDYHRRPYKYFSNNYTSPIVKRGNPYMFCGILFHVPQAKEIGQYCDDADVTTSVGHIDFGVRVDFEEWNVDFDQTAF